METTIYPAEVQTYIDILNNYVFDETLEQFSLIHLYPKGLAYPSGYYDSQFFEIVGYYWSQDGKIKLKRDIGKRDGIRFGDEVKVDIVRIFADGSTLIRFAQPVRVKGWYQCIEFAIIN